MPELPVPAPPRAADARPAGTTPVPPLVSPLVPPSETPLVPVRVWDLPTRLFHWLLALAFVGAIASAKIGGNAMVWHFRIGYCILALLAFRLLWGLVGGHWSRFASFLHTPASALRYLRGRLRPGEVVDIGHSPTGSAAVYALLALLLLQVATGLVADDEIANVGPLNRLVASTTAASATAWHHGYGQWLLIALALLHVLAIVFYLLRRRVNLVAPMLHGDKRLPVGTPASADAAPQRLLALLLVALCAALVGWIVTRGA